MQTVGRGSEGRVATRVFSRSNAGPLSRLSQRARSPAGAIATARLAA